MAKFPHKRQQLIEFDIVEKFKGTAATVQELRTGIWAPFEKIGANSPLKKAFDEKKERVVSSDKWGKVVVKGNILTQVHRDILDCIFAVSTNTRELPGGDIAVYFDRVDVLRKYGGEAAVKNHKWLKKKLDEINTTAIEFYENDSRRGNSFNIISAFNYSDNEGSYGIKISVEYRKFFEESLTIGYKNELERLLSVKSAFLRAVIRFFWTHDPNWRIPIYELLQTIGFPVDNERSVSQARLEINRNADLLESFGIVFEDLKEGKLKQRLIYRRDPNLDLSFIGKSQTVLPPV